MKMYNYLVWTKNEKYNAWQSFITQRSLKSGEKPYCERHIKEIRKYHNEALIDGLDIQDASFLNAEGTLVIKGESADIQHLVVFKNGKWNLVRKIFSR